MVGFICHTHVQSKAVHVAVDSYARQPKFTTSANDTYRNFASIGNKHFLKWPVGYSQRIHERLLVSYNVLLSRTPRFENSIDSRPEHPQGVHWHTETLLNRNIRSLTPPNVSFLGKVR